MYKYTTTYKLFDEDETEVTEDFYFNLTKAELYEFEFLVPGGLSEKLKKVSKTKDASSVMKYLKDIMKKAYGVKSDDGRHFKKSDEIFNDFESTRAYDNFFMEHLMDPKKAVAFITGIMPSEVQNAMKDEKFVSEHPEMAEAASLLHS